MVLYPIVYMVLYIQTVVGNGISEPSTLYDFGGLVSTSNANAQVKLESSPQVGVEKNQYSDHHLAWICWSLLLTLHHGKSP